MPECPFLKPLIIIVMCVSHEQVMIRKVRVQDSICALFKIVKGNKPASKSWLPGCLEGLLNSLFFCLNLFFMLVLTQKVKECFLLMGAFKNYCDECVWTVWFNLSRDIYSTHLVDPSDLNHPTKNSLNHEYTNHLVVRYLSNLFQMFYRYFFCDLAGILKTVHYVSHILIES